jgi:hypothetical protein
MILQEMAEKLPKALAFSGQLHLAAENFEKAGETIQFRLPLAVLDGKVRTALKLQDIADQLQARPGANPQLAQFKALAEAAGLTELILVSDTHDQKLLLILPGMKAACRFDPRELQRQALAKAGQPAAAGTPAAAPPKAAFKELAKETVNGLACVKKQATVAMPAPGGGESAVLTLWQAEKLMGFPAKASVESSRGMVTYELRELSMAKPDATSFATPAEFTLSTNPQEFVQQVVQKVIMIQVQQQLQKQMEQQMLGPEPVGGAPAPLPLP